MDETNYRLKITDFCSHIGIGQWEQVVRTQHIEVNGRTIGLIPDPGDDGRLSLYIDLGPVYVERDPRMFEQMLTANMEQRGALSGAFCIHPDNGNAVYHMTVTPQVTGEELAGHLAGALEHIVAHLDALTRARN